MCVSFGRVMCLIFCMLWVSNLFSSLIESLGFRCGNSVIALVVHSSSSSVRLSWKFSSKLLR